MGAGNGDIRERVRTGLGAGSLRRALFDNLFYVLGRSVDSATTNDFYQAAAYTIRDRVLHRMHETARAYRAANARTVAYLSAEFLLGPHLANNVMALNIQREVIQLGNELGLVLQELIDEEQEPGLGNGGLGRLAACYLDSLATLQIPAIGYGIRYEYGIFRQEIREGRQVEVTDYWLHSGNPWEVCRPKLTFEVHFGGHTQHYHDSDGARRVHWIPAQSVRGVAYDTPILGYHVNNANLLRLWRAEAAESLDFQAFNVGDYYGAVARKVASETLSKVLYPNDEPEAGKRLRLQQQYFFVSCSLQDMMRIHLRLGGSPEAFHERWAAQLNDTHPAIAVPELLRLLVDEHGLPFDRAWEVTRRTFAYTNHTLLPEALERWSVPLLADLLPRHMELIFEINASFLKEVQATLGNDLGAVARLSIIDESGQRSVRMAHLACVGSHAINGVAELHTQLLKSTVLTDFHRLWPDKIRNKTNGVSPRRFLNLANPGLSVLISRHIGVGWVTDLEQLRALEEHAEDSGFRDAWRACRRENKEALAEQIISRAGVTVDPDSLFDIHVKRMHEYKRQHLNILHVISLYQRLKEDPHFDIHPRTFVFGGKAAPGYAMAKLMIELIHAVGGVVNEDPTVNDRLRVVFFPNFNVKTSHHFYPAADLSEQISMAGKEASGTGNMKFAMNGALTIGTLDGANIEIREEVGEENFFLFGLTADEVVARSAAGYQPGPIIAGDDLLSASLALIESGFFSGGDGGRFRPLVDSLRYHDPFFVIADFADYAACQARVDAAFRDSSDWARRSILNTARTGKFSSDRSIREYCEDIWHVEPLPIAMAPDKEYVPDPAALAEARSRNTRIRG